MSLDQPTIDQIRQWFVEGAIDPILTMLETFKSQRDRAEFLVEAYKHHIKELAMRTDRILKPMLEKTETTAPKAPAETTKAPVADLTNLL